MTWLRTIERTAKPVGVFVGWFVWTLRSSFVFSSPFMLILFHPLLDLRVWSEEIWNLRYDEPFGQPALEVEPFADIG